VDDLQRVAVSKRAALRLRQPRGNGAGRRCAWPRLRKALAAQWTREYGREVDWEAEVTVTSGATEGLYGLIQALVDPGDRVVVLEPAYDAYHADLPAAASHSARWAAPAPSRCGSMHTLGRDAPQGHGDALATPAGEVWRTPGRRLRRPYAHDVVLARARK
jgi:Aminotransferase class I and II